MKHNDDLGKRLLKYESQETNRKLIPLLPIIARMDGRSFHRFTKDMKRPYDPSFLSLMHAVAEMVARDTQACMAYTQSDEISLIWNFNNSKTQSFFDGKIFKLTSILASMTTVYFHFYGQKIIEDWNLHPLPMFDARVWNVPNKEEAVNTLIWREQDAVRNSINMLGQHFYSHKELLNKSKSQVMDMLMEKDINWNNYPVYFKRGQYIQRFHYEKQYTTEELEHLPEHHIARRDPKFFYERTSYRLLPDLMLSLSKTLNRIGVVFEGMDPVPIKEEK
jgi:tRNA(His) 5'-end guanylyltransferase